MLGACYPCLFTRLRRMRRGAVSNLITSYSWESVESGSLGVVSKPPSHATSEFSNLFSLSFPHSYVAILHDYLRKQPFYLTCILKPFALVQTSSRESRSTHCLIYLCLLISSSSIIPPVLNLSMRCLWRNRNNPKRVNENNGQNYLLEFEKDRLCIFFFFNLMQNTWFVILPLIWKVAMISDICGTPSGSLLLFPALFLYQFM